MGNELSLGPIGQIGITCRDVARAEMFYRDVLGMKHLFSVSGLAFFDAGGQRLMLGRAEEQDPTHRSSILYFKVPDLAAAHQTLLGRNVPFDHAPQLIAAMPDHDLWMAFFRDSEDNVMALMSELPRA